MHHTKYKAFTLVELIVVVTILAILSTIGFVSYSGYLTGVRDTNRISQVSGISSGLNVYSTQNTLPIPEDNVEVQINGEVIGYQGYAGSSILGTIGFSNGGQDPKDDTYFSYYTTKNGENYQLMTLLEESDSVALSPSLLRKGLGGGVVNAADYSERYPKVAGKKLGILTDEANTPLQEVPSIKTAGELNITSATIGYIGYIASNETVTNSELLNIHPETSCKRIKQIQGSSKDGVYKINPEGTDGFEVYCDMTTDGGGWTLVDNIASDSDTMGTRTLGANTDLGITKGSLLSSYSWSQNPQLLCKASFYDGTNPWLTIDILTDEAKLYPTSNSTGISTGVAGHFSVNNLNGNTDNGSNFYYSTGIWLGSGSINTCACGYQGTRAGLGDNSSDIRTCSTWVR